MEASHRKAYCMRDVQEGAMGCARERPTITHLPLFDYCLVFRHSHGGTGCGSTHKPFFASRASFSSPSSTVSPGAYFRYHQHQPSLTSVVIDVGAIQQEHVCKGAPVLVLAVGLEDDIFPED